MVDPPSDTEPEPVLEAGLQLRRNAVRGFAFGAVVAAGVFVVFVVRPAATRFTGLYVGLAIVLGASIGLLATIVLVALRMRRLSKVL